MSSGDLRFLPGMAEKLLYYVYALRDPRDEKIFYVGKGKGDRVYQHAAQARAVPGETPGELKLNTIRAIHAAGEEVIVELIRHGLTEKEAFEVEAGIIDALWLGGELTNEARGMFSRDRGWAPLEALRDRYAARPIGEIPESVVLMRINQRYWYGMPDEELYSATREWWKRAAWRTPDYAFAVYHGIVRAVFRIDPDGWVQEPGRGRWQFAGERDPELEARYVGCDVSAYLPDAAQYPLRYVNC